MHMRYGLLADAVVSTGGGKFAAVGTFNVIWARSFPHTHPKVGILVRLETDRGDNSEHKLAIDLVNPIGERLNGVNGTFRFGETRIEGSPVAIEIGLEVVNLVLPTDGNYDFAVRVDEAVVDMIPLYVRNKSARPSSS